MLSIVLNISFMRTDVKCLESTLILWKIDVECRDESTSILWKIDVMVNPKYQTFPFADHIFPLVLIDVFEKEPNIFIFTATVMAKPVWSCHHYRHYRLSSSLSCRLLRSRCCHGKSISGFVWTFPRSFIYQGIHLVWWCCMFCLLLVQTFWKHYLLGILGSSINFS